MDSQPEPQAVIPRRPLQSEGAPLDLQPRCPHCAIEYTVVELLEDLSIEPIGMRLEEDEPELSLYFFNHACHSTFTVPVGVFAEHFQSALGKPPWPDRTSHLVVAPCDSRCGPTRDDIDCLPTCPNAAYRRFLVEVLARPERRLALAAAARRRVA